MKQLAVKIALEKKHEDVTQNKDRILKKTALILMIPEIKKAREEYIHAVFANALGNYNEQEEIAYNKYITALKNNNFSEEDFVYNPSCEKCNDTGIYNRKVCDCTRKYYIDALKNICKIDEKAHFKFSDINLEKIKNSPQYEFLNKFYKFAKAYALKLPNVNSKNILLFGATGTGKSFVASCMAQETIERGKSVKYVSAYEFNTSMLNFHTSPLSKRHDIIRDYLTADFLVIDDLGTEPMLKNVTNEYLLLVLEERTNRGLCTLITTNLDLSKLLNRYGERIYSRLADKQNSKVFNFEGVDLRLL